MSAGWSLRGRLVRRVLIGACLGWGVGVGLAALVVATEMSEMMDDSLDNWARLAMTLYQEAGSPQTGRAGLDRLTQGEIAIRIIDHGVVVADAPWPPLAGDATGRVELPGWHLVRLEDPDRGLVLEAGQDKGWRRDELAESLRWLIALLLPVLLAAPLAVRGAVASALAPVARFAAMLARRPAQDLSPVTAPDLPAELVPIPQALNGYLDRIRAQLEAERQFTTNAAHELRTPLAAASGQAQLIAAGLADAGAATRLAGALGRMGDMVQNLLQLARAEAGTMGRGPCDLVRIARLVIADLGQPVPGQPVHFDDGEMAEAPVAVDPEALALILRNLLRNAAEHGRGDLRVRLTPGPVLRISNAVAPGAAFRPNTFEKSARSQGAGLGLSIVARMARAQDIAVDYALAQGRAVVTLRLPPAPPTSSAPPTSGSATFGPATPRAGMDPEAGAPDGP